MHKCLHGHNTNRNSGQIPVAVRTCIQMWTGSERIRLSALRDISSDAFDRNNITVAINMNTDNATVVTKHIFII